MIEHETVINNGCPAVIVVCNTCTDRFEDGDFVVYGENCIDFDTREQSELLAKAHESWNPDHEIVVYKFYQLTK